MKIDIQTLATTLGGTSPSGKGSYSCLCPAHKDTTPSLSISLGDQDQLLLYCHAGCAFEDIVEALHQQGLLPGRKSEQDEHRLPLPSPKEGVNPYSRQLWHQSVPLEGTLGHVYLQTRLADLLEAIPPTLRYLPSAKHSPTGKVFPCLLAAVTVYPCRQVTAIHRTFLSLDGKGKAPVDTPKMMLGQVRGGAVRLAPPGQELMIAEGLETSLTLHIMLKKPTWAALSSQNMAQVILPPLPLAQTLYIAQDNDAGGQKGAMTLAEKAWAEGRTVRILQPPHRLNDFNDLLFYRGPNDPTS